MAPRDSPTSIRIRIHVLNPPPGVSFAIQRGRTDLLPPSTVGAGSIEFQFVVRLGDPLDDGSPNFLGEFAQGPPTDRFVYLNSGVRAGQSGSCWDRLAKLKFASIPRDLVEGVLGHQDRFIEARVVGTMKDGGPVCATVKPAAVSWKLS